MRNFVETLHVIWLKKKVEIYFKLLGGKGRLLTPFFLYLYSNSNRNIIKCPSRMCDLVFCKIKKNVQKDL